MSRPLTEPELGIARWFEPFWRWWTSELRNIGRSLLVQVSGARVIVASDPGGFTVFFEQAGPSAPSATRQVFPTMDHAAKALADYRSLEVVLRVNWSDCFSRTVELPRSASRDVARIMALDLERTTPFRHGDVVTAAYVAGQVSRHRIVARQMVMKSTRLQALIDPLAAVGRAPTAIDCWDEKGEQPLPIDFLATGKVTSPSPALRLLAMTGVLIGGLACSAVAFDINRHVRALALVRQEVANAQVAAQAAQGLIERTNTANARSASIARWRQDVIPRTAIVEELTQLLPDSVWLSDLRIDETTADFSGFAPSAAELVPLLAKGRLLYDPALTAPVTFDHREDRERFTIRVLLRRDPALAKG